MNPALAALIGAAAVPLVVRGAAFVRHNFTRDGSSSSGGVSPGSAMKGRGGPGAPGAGIIGGRGRPEWLDELLYGLLPPQAAPNLNIPANMPGGGQFDYEELVPEAPLLANPITGDPTGYQPYTTPYTVSGGVATQVVTEEESQAAREYWEGVTAAPEPISYPTVTQDEAFSQVQVGDTYGGTSDPATVTQDEAFDTVKVGDTWGGTTTTTTTTTSPTLGSHFGSRFAK